MTDKECGDIVDRALEALLTGTELEQLPPELVAELRSKVANKHPPPIRVTRPCSRNSDWLELARTAVCCLLILSASWLIASAQELLHQAAGVHTAVDGTVFTHFSDGQVRVTPRSNT